MLKVTRGGILLIIFLSNNLFSCKPISQERSNYEVEIIYQPKRHIRPSEVTKKWKDQVKDSVVLFFESGFENDKVTITQKNKTISERVKSNDVIQFARYFVVAPTQDEDTVTIQINSGKKIIVKTDGVKYIAVNFLANKIKVEMLDDFAYYD